jgi:hypothetical protein
MSAVTAEQTYYSKNRERILAESKRRYRSDAAYREARRAAARRYRSDPAHRETRLAAGRLRYQTDAAYRAASLANAKRRYALRHPEQARNRQKKAERLRAILKLRLGSAPLTEAELKCVLPKQRRKATEVKPRSLQAVGELFGLTRERVRQIIAGTR